MRPDSRARLLFSPCLSPAPLFDCLARASPHQKVDNHVHLAAAAPVKDFTAFLQRKAATESTVEVAPGRTLGQVLKAAGIDPNVPPSIDSLEVR